MKRIVTLAAAAAFLATAGVADAQVVREKVGALTCAVAGGAGFIIGSQKEADCIFRPDDGGPPERYSGTMSKIGIDIGVTAATEIIWAVAMQTTGRRGSLAGTYVGASGEATVIGGVGANVLIGGSNRTVSLQPLSIQGQTGLNIAGGIGELRLVEVRGRR